MLMLFLASKYLAQEGTGCALRECRKQEKTHNACALWVLSLGHTKSIKLDRWILSSTFKRLS